MNVIAMNAVSFTVRSHIGRVRTNNEDNFYCNGVFLTPKTRDAPSFLVGKAQSPCVFAVCDGMGGEADGEFASLMAVETLSEYAEAIKTAASSDSIDKAVQNFVSDANERLCKAMKTRYARMGTTLALAVITKSSVHTYNIGDSRIYRFQNGTFSQISEDHTLAAQKIKMRILTEEEARKDRSRHVLTRYLGVFEEEMILEANVIAPFKIDTKCRLLLCSDGITDMIEDSRIEAVLRDMPDTESAANELIESALQNGGKDNATCIIIDCGGA